MPQEPSSPTGKSKEMSTGARLAIVVGGTAVTLGLAVLGWGGFGAFFSHPPLTALAVVCLVVMIPAYFAGGNVSPGVREDKGNRWVIPAFGVLGLVSAWLPAYMDRHGWWTFGGDGVRWSGVVICAVGTALRLWPVYVLGNRFSGLVAIQPGHQLVTAGIYHTIRHPSYLGLVTSQVGWGLAFHSTAGVLLGILSVVPVVARIRAEEKMLRSEFGAEYEAYRAHTARLVPGVY